jgi:hypothetical protein
MENTSAVSASKKATGMADMQSSTFFISFSITQQVRKQCGEWQAALQHDPLRFEPDPGQRGD